MVKLYCINIIVQINKIELLFLFVASLGPAVFIVAASYAGCDKVSVVVLFCIGMGFMGTFYPGMKVNALDLASNYAGTLMAIVNGIGAIAGIVTPILIGNITKNVSLFVLLLSFAFVLKRNIDKY